MTDFAVFRDRFAEACRVRGITQEAVYRSIGLGGRRALDVQSVGVLRALDLYRVCQIADRVNVSLNWLLGRSEVMEIPKSAKDTPDNNRYESASLGLMV